MRRNKLAPKARSERYLNLALNLFWAIVWLGRWTMRLMRLGVDRILRACGKER
ncbi:hypothetical protein [Mitsuokella sp. oral taxon 131]|uniref:hypothetical protein n=1 Tax=Mitsuokella sp. oral taxon 131 TaxID=1321780 RepID=UPI0003AE4955|nr:hypothetical protein [Mitsuokella sp. oral taxon 131]ERL05059.1 hypothetical protein HMPREF1985_00812 [Mitsuokella sp. oral taxon 131 str. W9106]